MASQSDTQITHATILSDSMNLLQKMESGMGCPDWHEGTVVDCQINCGRITLAVPESEKTNGQIDWQPQQTLQTVYNLAGKRC